MKISIPIGQAHKDGSKTSQGAEKTQGSQYETKEAAILLTVKSNLKGLLDKLYSDLKENLYGQAEKVLIEKLNVLLNMKLAVNLRNQGIALIQRWNGRSMIATQKRL